MTNRQEGTKKLQLQLNQEQTSFKNQTSQGNKIWNYMPLSPQDNVLNFEKDWDLITSAPQTQIRKYQLAWPKPQIVSPTQLDLTSSWAKARAAFEFLFCSIYPHNIRAGKICPGKKMFDENLLWTDFFLKTIF